MTESKQTVKVTTGHLLGSSNYISESGSFVAIFIVIFSFWMLAELNNGTVVLESRIFDNR